MYASYWRSLPQLMRHLYYSVAYNKTVVSRYENGNLISLVILVVSSTRIRWQFQKNYFEYAQLHPSWIIQYDVTMEQNSPPDEQTKIQLWN